MSSQPAPLLRTDDLIDDSVVANVDGDEFEHDAIAGRVVEVLKAGRTPLNIALYGPWGSGKSSIYRLMKERMDADNSVKLVRYDAWKYGGDSLKRNFISSTARSLGLDHHKKFMQGLYETRREVRLDWVAFLKQHWRSLLLILLFAATVATGWAAIVSLAAIAKGHFLDDFWKHLPTSMLTLGTVLLTLMTSLKIVDGANLTVESSAPSSDEQFAETFRELIASAKRKYGAQRLVFFVDELDRCAPSEVVSTLVSLKTFLDEPDAAFVVAADRLVLEAALDDGLRQVTPIRTNEPYYSTSGAFLEKIFQYQFALPPLRERALTGFARDLVAQRGGLWRQIRELGSDELLEAVVYVLIPAHVRSPRRVKALLNSFATSCRVAEARGISWLPRVLELAQLSTLEIEFPDVARSLLSHPSLLQALRNEDSASDGAKEVANALKTGAGPSDLIEDDDNGSSMDERSAAVTALHRQLVRYLERVVVTGVVDPSPDLFYLQQPGGSQRFESEAVARAVDMSEDESVATTLRAFEGASPADCLLGIEVLLGMAENAFGPGRGNVLEAAARLSEEVPGETLRRSARRFVAPLVAAEKKHDLRDAASPGAIRILAAAESDSLILLIAGHGTDARTLLEASHLAGAMKQEDINVLTDFILELIKNGNDDLLTELILRADERIVTELVKASATVMLERLEKSGVEMAGTRAVPAHKDFADAQSKLNELVKAAEGRVMNPDLMVEVMTFALGSDDADLQSVALSVAREHIEIAAEGAPRSAIALIASSYAEDAEFEFWASNITGGEPAALAGFIVRMLDSLRLDESGEVTSGISSAIAKIGGLIPSIESTDELRAGAQALLDQENWAQGGASRVDNVYGTVRALESVLGAETISELLSSDIRREAIASSFSASGLVVLRRQLDASGSDTVRLLAEALEAEALSEKSLVARLEFYAVRRTERSTVRLFADISEYVENGEVEVIADWLGAKPAVEDVLTLMGRGRVSLHPISGYVRHLGDADADRLWLEAESLGWPTAHLRALARHTVGDSAVARLRERIVLAPRSDERAAATERLLTVPFTSQSPGADRLMEIALDLLKTGIQTNAALAAQVVGHLQMIPRGYKMSLRDEFNAAQDRHAKAFNAAQSQKLGKLGVLSPQKKSIRKKRR
jgi:hypothetical protein